MIFGIGTDIAAIGRFETLLEQYGERVITRLLAPAERPGFEAAAHPAAFLAKRFAAKEALGKAARTGVVVPLGLNDIWINHDAAGAPVFEFSERARAWLTTHGIIHCHLSLSDERNCAIAFVVLEKDAVAETTIRMEKKEN